MPSLRATLWSSVGKKLITGVTGLALFAFIIVHLLGNLTMLIGPGAFNGYAHFLESLIHGWAVIAFEIVMIAILLFHGIAAVNVALVDKYRARPIGYKKVANAGGPSRKTLSSRSMIITGSIILVFLVIHVRMFKFGDMERIPLPNGGEMKDLYTLVVTSFKNPLIVVSYVAVMILLGSHLWHGFWSAFQSLGLTNARTISFLHGLGVAFAVVLAFGYIFLPIYAYLFLDPSAAQAPHAGGH